MSGLFEVGLSEKRKVGWYEYSRHSWARMKKVDLETGEEFECAGDASCWCVQQPLVMEIEAVECVGPQRLKVLIKEKTNDTESDL